MASEETVSLERSQASRAAVGAARLVIVHPRELAGVHALGEGEVVLARAAEAAGSLVVAHPTVSRQHATVRWDASVRRHSLADRGSRNGTWLEGQPVGRVSLFLADQAVLRLGDVVAVYERREVAPVDPPEVSREAVPGLSLAACALRETLARAGPDRSPVLIEGETGVGKESIAAELHRLSGRPGPLVPVNCAALSATVIESQLFGHVRGAFTGATQEHAGLFRAAAGGTLFLDELGELPLELQPKLLRAVELGEITAVGSTRKHHVDVRVIAATNRPLADDIARGTFRRDLHARLALWQVTAPPLRARRADLLGWIDRLHRDWRAARGRPEDAAIELQTDAVEALLLQPWPSNLRGLQHLVHACAAAAARDRLSREQLAPWLHDMSLGTDAAAPSPTPAPARGQQRRPSREELLAALAQHNWSLRATAKSYGRDRRQIVRWIDMYAIEVPWRREADGDE